MFTDTRLEPHLHLYEKDLLYKQKQQENPFFFFPSFYRPKNYSGQFSIDGPHHAHSDWRFVLLYVIRIGDASGRCKWEAEQGAPAQ